MDLSPPRTAATAHRAAALLAQGALAVALAAALGACNDGPPILDGRGQQVDYRDGTEASEYTSNGERGNVMVTEVMWSGSVRGSNGGNARVHDPDDIFIEFQNKHPRPIHLTGWQLILTGGFLKPGKNAETGRRRRQVVTYTFPLRENLRAVEPNEYVVLAAKRDGAFREADYYIEDLKLPDEQFQITIRDIDDRLINGSGNTDQEPFAGGYDGVTTRSMERIQLIFANQGGREVSWHAYALNPWDAFHTDELGQFIHPEYRTFTLASPGRANSPDYSGNTAAGDFQ